MASCLCGASFLIEALEPYPDVKIVLSTNWVRRKGYTWTKEALPEALQRRVIGATWHSRMINSDHGGWGGGFNSLTCWYDDATRFQQIARYVQRAKVSHWIALDDLHEHEEEWDKAHQQHIILTNHNTGLSDPDVLAQLKKRLEVI
jgi:hypothetical protein